MNKAYLSDEVIILARHPFAEKDYILSTLTKRGGKMAFIAKGVRSITSKRAGHIDLFNRVTLHVRKTKGMGVVSEASVLEDHRVAKEDVDRLNQMYHVSELVDKLIPDEEFDDYTYRLVRRIFTVLNKSDNTIEQLQESMRTFEITMLRHLGFWSDEEHSLAYKSQAFGGADYIRDFVSQLTDRPMKSEKVFSTLLRE